MTSVTRTRLEATSALVSSDAACGAVIELAHRDGGGIEVALWWNQLTGELKVSVRDRGSGSGFDVPADAHDALDVFNHPYAYAYARRISHWEPDAYESPVS